MNAEPNKRDWIRVHRDWIHSSKAPTKLIASRHVFDAMEAATGYKKAAMVSRSRKERLVTPRYMTMYLLYNNTRRTQVQVGVLVNRQHTTVLHGCQSVRKKMVLDPEFRQRMKAIEIDIQRRSHVS